MRILNFTKAEGLAVNIQESLSYESNVLKNRIWYRGDPYELDQFFKGTNDNAVAKSRFWAAVPTENNSIRKYHAGLPGEIVDKMSDIVISDLDSIEVDPAEDPDGEGEQKSPGQEAWDEIAKDNRFYEELLADAIRDTLITGDGAFKFSVDEELTEWPIIEYYSGEQVKYEYKRGRLQSIIFSTKHIHEKRTYRLEEKYGRGTITYKLFEDSDDNEESDGVPLSTVPELADLEDHAFSGDFIMAEPMRFFKSSKFEGRGQSIYDRKSDNFDALDEIVSQWIDAIRAGRVKNYIPEDLLPKGDSGEVLSPNAFDNQFIKRGTSMKENAEDKIDQIQAAINYSAFLESYASALDMCLQGVMSPATLGIDLKKTDNALAQREKEKTTLYTRGKIVDVLDGIIPRLVDSALKVLDNMQNKEPGEYESMVTFGEYASPDFNEKIAVVGAARSHAVMSLETAIEEIYGDRKDQEWKDGEVERIRAELEPPTEEPALNIDGLGMDYEEPEENPEDEELEENPEDEEPEEGLEDEEIQV